MALTKERRSGRLVRSASERRASERPRPICISCSMRANSSASGPSVLRATWAQAASKPRPGLDRDREQVDRVGQGALQLLGAVVGLLVEVHVRAPCSRPASRARRTPAWAGSRGPAAGRATSETTRATAKPTTLPAITRSTVQPRGLPASSSFSRMRSLASSGVSSAAHPLAAGQQGEQHAVGEASASSSPFISSGAAVSASRTAIERLTPGRSLKMPPTAPNTRSSATKIRREAAQDDDRAHHTSTFATLDIQKMPTLSSTAMTMQQDPADRRGVHRVDVVGLGQGEVDQEAGRQAAQDVAGEPTLGRERAHVAAQVLALAQGGGHGEQELGQVAADLALDPDGHHDPLEVAALHPLGDALHRVLEGDAEPGLDRPRAGTRRRSARRPRARSCRSTAPGTGRPRGCRTSAAGCRRGRR